MVQLAIKGHATRGKEVINLLEMLGANRLGYKDTFIGFYYYIECGAICSSDEYPTNSTIFTLEEFEEKYPYKVGDEVEYKSIGDANLKSKIIYMEWCNALNEVLYTTEDAHVISTEDIIETKSIPPYMDYDIKEGIMEEKRDKAKAPNLVGEDYSGKRFGYKIPQGYEVDCIQNNKIIIKPIKPQYPTTYEECCDILHIETNRIIYYEDCLGYRDITRYDINLLTRLRYFRRLLICRDAYWKIAGKQMGLGKLWEPDFTNNDEERYGIYTLANKVERDFCGVGDVNMVLSFPTEEMRDAFYDNFKELIEECKELL